MWVSKLSLVREAFLSPVNRSKGAASCLAALKSSALRITEIQRKTWLAYKWFNLVLFCFLSFFHLVAAFVVILKMAMNLCLVLFISFLFFLRGETRKKDGVLLFWIERLFSDCVWKKHYVNRCLSPWVTFLKQTILDGHIHGYGQITVFIAAVDKLHIGRTEQRFKPLKLLPSATVWRNNESVWLCLPAASSTTRILYTASVSVSTSCHVLFYWNSWPEETWRASWGRTGLNAYVISPTPHFRCIAQFLTRALWLSGPSSFSQHARAAADGQGHCMWLPLLGRESLHTQVPVLTK